MKLSKKKITASLMTVLMAGTMLAPAANNIDSFISVNPAGVFQVIDANAASYNYTYYPKCNSSKTSIVDGLKSIGVDSSFSNRKSIASLNGYINYTGKASENLALLNLLKNGKLVKSKTVVNNSRNTTSNNISVTYYSKCNSKYTSIVDALNSIGVNSSFNNRKNIALLNNISNYSGTSSQNMTMLNLLKNGKLIKSRTSTSNSNLSYCTPLTNNNIYYISPACATSSVIDVSGAKTSNGSNIQIWGKSNVKNQQFKAKLISNGYYAFYDVNSGKVIDVSGGIVANGTNIQIYQYNGTDAQLWRLIDAGNGYYYLQSKLNSSYYLDVNGAGNNNGTNVHLYKGNSSSAQKFRFTTVTITNNSNKSTTNNGSLIENKYYNVSVSNKAQDNQPRYENVSGKRDTVAYNTVINQFNVESNPRYKKTSTSTYCNIFAWDVMSAMHVSLPHWLKNNQPATYATRKGAYELNANATYNWLKDYGSNYGWRVVSKKEAQSRANSGYPTIAIWKNPSGASGHVMVVRPEGNGYYYSDYKGPVIAQAGSSNKNYWNVVNSMGKYQPMYYTHN